MKYYIRFSQNIESDIERGCSYHYTGLDRDSDIESVAAACGVDVDDIEYNEAAKQYVQVLPGLCAFELDAETMEEAIEEAKAFNFNWSYSAARMPFWHILTGRYCGDCPEGDTIDNVELLYSNEYDKSKW